MNNKNIDHQVVLFDGVCNFCNYWVNFIMDRDPDDRFRFAALQSEAGQQLLEKFDLPTDDFDSFVLIKEGKVHKKSSAALIIASQIKSWTKILTPFLILPPFLRDWLYSLIGKNRYKLFGKKDSCRIPTPEERSKFL